MKSQRGESPGGENVDPRELPDEPVDTDAEPRSAPAPGVPVSREEFERMKEAAKHAPARRVNNSPEDGKKKKEKG